MLRRRSSRLCRTRGYPATALIAAAGVAVLSGCVGASPAQSAGSGREDPGVREAAVRELVLMVDGVPYELVDSLWRAGHFRGFGQPAAVIGPFPSLTNVAFDDVWGEATSGYEDRWFDPLTNRIRGGLLDHLLKPAQDGGFHRHVDIETDPVSAGLAYLFPGPLARRELRALRAEVHARAASDSLIVAYAVTTDALAHRAGRAGVVQHLLELERLLAEVRRVYGPGVRINVFSDHGNDLVPTRAVDLDSALEAAGFRRTDRLAAAGDVVAIRFGLVGSVALHVQPEEEPRLAAALVDVPGVELAVFEEAGGPIHVWGESGRATIDADLAGGRFRYAPLEGDPLGLNPALERLRASGRIDGQGFARDADWLEASLETPYVDALRRIALALGGGVRHPGDVVLSLAPGYHYGDPAADLLVDVTGTHGSLRTSASLAFLLSSHARVPALLRGEELLRHLRGLE